MSKKIKIIIPVVIILLVLIAGGIFWWQWKKEFPKMKTINEREFVDSAEYEVIETPEGKIVENKKERLAIKVPEDWTVKKYGGEVDLLSPETEFDQYGGISFKSVKEKGACGLAIQIIKSKKVDPEIMTDVEEIGDLITKAQESPINEEGKKYEVFMVGGKLGLKKIILKENKEISISVEVPIDNTLYSFNSGLIFSEKCVQEFNKILETVSIK